VTQLALELGLEPLPITVAEARQAILQRLAAQVSPRVKCLYQFSASDSFVHLSRPGLDAGVLVAFRLATMGIPFIIVCMTTDPFDWGMAM
jgi:hypothetical protein